MEMSRLQMVWASTKTFPGRACGIQPDQQFIPQSRMPPPGQPQLIQRVAPTLVIETGVNESLRKLRWDAGWWLTNTNGEVKIVLVVSINLHSRTVLLEKWQMASSGTGTRQTIAPQAVHTIQIAQHAANGAPLILGFADLMLRAPIPPEQDLIFSASDLIQCYRSVW